MDETIDQKPNVNEIKPLIKWEMIAVVLQFLVLLCALIFSYASLQARQTILEEKLNRHLDMHGAYLRTDIWETRNKFIDEKLDRIERKVDQLVAHDVARMSHEGLK